MKRLNNPLWGAKEYDSHWTRYNSPGRMFEYEREILNTLTGVFREGEFNRIRIVDIGCGIGRLMVLLYHHGFTSIKGIDISPIAIERMNKTYPELDGEVGDATRIDFREYDLAIITEVIEHLEDDLCLKLPEQWIGSVPNGDTIAKSHMRSYEPEDIKKRFNADIFYIGKWIIFGKINK
jgi:2-polyprenyl-3-methyl-5-hydroxy-6-metoxy-1,4-benzoquinol methylase